MGVDTTAVFRYRKNLPTKGEEGFPEGEPESLMAVPRRGTLAPRVEMSLAR